MPVTPFHRPKTEEMDCLASYERMSFHVPHCVLSSISLCNSAQGRIDGDISSVNSLDAMGNPKKQLINVENVLDIDNDDTAIIKSLLSSCLQFRQYKVTSGPSKGYASMNDDAVQCEPRPKTRPPLSRWLSRILSSKEKNDVTTHASKDVAESELIVDFNSNIRLRRRGEQLRTNLPSMPTTEIITSSAHGPKCMEANDHNEKSYLDDEIPRKTYEEYHPLRRQTKKPFPTRLHCIEKTLPRADPSDEILSRKSTYTTKSTSSPDVVFMKKRVKEQFRNPVAGPSRYSLQKPNANADLTPQKCSNPTMGRRSHTCLTLDKLMPVEIEDNVQSVLLPALRRPSQALEDSQEFDLPPPSHHDSALLFVDISGFTVLSTVMELEAFSD